MISFGTLNIRIGLLEETLTAVLSYNISVLSVIYIKLYKSYDYCTLGQLTFLVIVNTIPIMTVTLENYVQC